MKKTMAFVGVLVFVIFAGYSVFAAEGPVEKFVEKQINQFETACKTELETYCQTVTPGEGRGLACIYAHNDKLSRPCENALYDSADEFRKAGEKLDEFAGACQADIEKLCSTVAIGEGRILACLKQNKTQVSETCQKMVESAGSENLSGQKPGA